LCEVIPGQLYERKVPEYLTAKVIDFAKVKPQVQFIIGGIWIDMQGASQKTKI
jgi:hypothetical protein